MCLAIEGTEDSQLAKAREGAELLHIVSLASFVVG